MDIPAPSFVTIHGRRMAFDEVRPPAPRGVILLLTGLAANRLGWWNQLHVFGRDYRTIALDHRETGDSDPTGQPYTADDMADDAAAVLDALGIPRAHIVGISLGGNVTLRLALRRPGLAQKLVLTSTFAGGASYVPPSSEMIAMLGRPNWELEPGERRRRTYAAIAGPGFAEAHPDVMDHIAGLGRHNTLSPEAYMRQLQAVYAGADISSQLAGIIQPALVIHGDADPLVPVANGRYLAQHIPGARLVIYPGVGHVPILECPAEYNREVLAFLAT